MTIPRKPPFRQRKALEGVLLFGDPHAPFHNQRAWNLMLDVARELKPSHIVHLGDHFDAYCISSYAKKLGRRLDLQWEIDVANELMDDLAKIKAKVKIMTGGNHDERFCAYAADRPELVSMLGSVPKLLHLKERGWSFTPHFQSTRLGKIRLTHQVGRGGGRGAVHKALDRYQHSVVHGHTHRLGMAVESTALGDKPKVSVSFGWMGDVEQIDYEHRDEARACWPNAFGWGRYDTTTGYVYLQPVPILPDYSCMVDGILFKG